MDNLDELLLEYIEDNYSPEQQDEVKNALALFEAFDYVPVYSKLNDVISDFSQDDNDQRRTDFLALILEANQNLLSAHSLSLLDTSELRITNRILATIYKLQSFEDPTALLRLLESGLSNEEKFAKIVDYCTDIDEGVALSVLDSISDEFIGALRKLLEDREEMLSNQDQPSMDDLKILDQIKDQMKRFYTCHGKDNIAFVMEGLGFEIGYSASIYWHHIKDELIVNDDTMSAKNLLGFFFYAKDTYLDPIAAYHRCSEILIPETDRRIKIDTILRDLLLTVQNYQKAQDDAKRLSTI